MSDSDNPEIPSTPDPTESPKPGIWDVFNKPKENRVLDEGDPNYVAGQETPPPTDEELMRVAAIKCAEMEEELATLLSTQTANYPSPSIHSLDNKGLLVEKHVGKNSIQGEIDDIRKNDKPARVQFNDGIANHAGDLRKETNKELSVWINADESLTDALGEYEEKYTRPAMTITDYYFTKDGKYRKVITVDKRVRLDPSRELLYPPPMRV